MSLNNSLLNTLTSGVRCILRQGFPQLSCTLWRRLSTSAGACHLLAGS